MKRTGAFFAIVAVLLGALAAPAFAHATLDSSSPSAGQTVATSPINVELRFDENVQVSLGGVRVFDSRGHQVDTSAPSHPGGGGSRISVHVPHLGNGSYVVTWRVISADTHPVRGAFVFSVGTPTTNRNISGLSATLLNRQSGDITVGVLFGIARFLVFVGLLLFVGGVAFIVFVWPTGRFEQRARRIVWGSWLTALFGTVLGVVVQGPYDAARSLGAITNASIWNDVLDTRFDEVWLTRVALLLVAVPLVCMVFRREPERGRPSSWWRGACALVAVGLLGTPALAGHAGSGPLLALTIVFDTVHVGAAAVWLGGLIVLALVVLTSRSSVDLPVVVPRFSAIAFASVLTLSVTGFLRGWREVGSFGNLLSTSYGHILDVKLAAFVLLVALAFISHRLVRRRSLEPASVQTLRRSVATELVIGIVVLVATALLVNAPPARSQVTGPYAKTLETSKAWFDVQVIPAKAGLNEMHFTISDPTGRGNTVQDFKVQFELPSRGIAPITIPLERITSGHYLTPRADIPISGNWTMTITALVSATEEVRVTDTVSIR